MKGEHETIVDFVARGISPNQWRMILVEEGPWLGKVEVELRRIQDRLYGCIDAALDGQLAEKFPESDGKDIVVQLDCYNVPADEVSRFFERFTKGVFSIPDYKRALEGSPHARNIEFEVTFDSIN